MEFLRMPLTKLQSKPTTTTTLSCFDRMERNQTIKITKELHAERKAEEVPAKRARTQQACAFIIAIVVISAFT